MTPPQGTLPRLAAKALSPTDLQGERRSPASFSRTPLAARRRPVSVACRSCQGRRIKCDGARPTCQPCQKSALACAYEAPAGLSRRQSERNQIAQLQDTIQGLQRENASLAAQTIQSVQSVQSAQDGFTGHQQAHNQHTGSHAASSDSSAELVELLRNQPEEFALNTLRSLRQGHTSEAIMASLRGDLSTSINPSLVETARGSFTPTQTPLEFQLIIQHPKAYPQIIPLEASSLDLQILGIEPMRTSNNLNNGLPTLLQGYGPSAGFDTTISPQDMSRGGGKDAVMLMDARLRHVDISRWTSIQISNHFAAEAIALYLEMNQPWWAFFDTDLFLDDLISGRTKFCSQMLVTAILAWSTQSYAHFEPVAATLSSVFLNETIRLYDTEASEDLLTTVAATAIASMTWTTLGNDKAGRRMQEASASMAQRLHLYGGIDGLARSPLDLSDIDTEKAACVTAWGSFNFQMVMSMSFHQKPLPKRPPRFRIPGEAWASRLDATYTAICQFWLIVFDMNCLHHLQQDFSLPSAVAIFQRLLAWADALPSGVERDAQSPDYVLNIHVWFHTAVIDLFRPFEQLSPQPRLPPFAVGTNTPKAVIAASVAQLKRMIYQYRSNCRSAKYSIIWQSGMLYLVNHLMRDLASNEAQFYFLLCMRGYQYLARHMPFVNGVMQSLLYMADRQGVTLGREVQRLFEEVQGENLRTQQFLSAYPVDLGNAPLDPSSTSLEHLAGRFQEQASLATKNHVSHSGPLPDGWRGPVEGLATTFLLPENNEDASEMHDQY